MTDHQDIECIKTTTALRRENDQLRENLAFAQQRAADNDLRARIGEDKIRDLTEQLRCDLEVLRSHVADNDRLRAEKALWESTARDMEQGWAEDRAEVDRLRAENALLHAAWSTEIGVVEDLMPVVDAARAWAADPGAYWARGMLLEPERALIDAVRALNEGNGQ